MIVASKSFSVGYLEKKVKVTSPEKKKEKNADSRVFLWKIIDFGK